MITIIVFIFLCILALSGFFIAINILNGIFRRFQFNKIIKEYELTNTYTSNCKKLLGIKGNDLYIFSSSKEYDKINFAELETLIVKEEDYILKSFPETSPFVPRAGITPGNLTLTIGEKNNRNHEILFFETNPHIKDRQDSIFKMYYRKVEDYYELLKKQII